MAKFVANNNILALTKLFLFFTTKDMHLYINFDLVEQFDTSTYK